MAIAGSKRESVEKQLKCGWSNSTIFAVSPNKSQSEKLGLYVGEDVEEIEYTFEKDGVNGVKVVFWLKDTTTEYVFNKTFYLYDKPRWSKLKEGQNEDDFIPKQQFVNCIGDSQWVEDGGEFPEFFISFKSKGEFLGKKTNRAAKEGEDSLLAFVKVWLSQLNYYSPDTNILLDTKALFKGNFKELQEQVEGEFANPVLALLGVKAVEKDGEIKEYQDVYKKFIKGFNLKVLNNTTITDAYLNELKTAKKSKSNPEGRYLKEHEQWLLDITGDGFDNYSSHYVLKSICDYNSEDNFAASKDVVQSDDNMF